MTASVLLPLVLLAPLSSPAQDAKAGPTVLAAEITEVTVYSGSASVRRTASLPRGGGSFAIAGLPRATDPNSLRVRAASGEVVGVELRDRFEKGVPEERVNALRARVKGLEGDLQVLRDERAVLDRLAAHLDNLVRGGGDAQPAAGATAAASSDGPSVDAWRANLKYLTGKLAEVREARRSNGWLAQEVEAALKDARLELGRFDSSGGVAVYDLIVDVFDPNPRDTAPGVLEVDTIVGNAGWSPAYDLRAPKELADVELVYRARVWQRTGEDWSDVALLLSTAQPQRGAQGPDPRPETLSLYDPAPRRGFAVADEAPAPSARPTEDGAWKGPSDSVPPFASVSEEGLSVRFRIPRKETVESRDQPTTVLLGRTRLALTPEHYCLPAVDTTVWLRGRSRNTSEWEMLPGRAAVYFGADFIGHADLPAVRRDDEFTVHLGPDPGVVVERTKLVDTSKEAGTFGSKRTLREAWRIELKNPGAFSNARDGSVDVIVHEVLPRTKDDRVKVKVERAEPRTAGDARWQKLMEDKGVLTWVVRVPKGGAGRIELETSIAFPEDLELVRN